MPIYAYRCRTCGEEFEKLFLSTRSAAGVTCPDCQSEEVERRPTAFGVASSSKGASLADSSCAPSGGG